MGEFQFQDLVIYHYILSDMALLHNTKPEYFQNSVIRGMFTIAKEHAEKYSTPPSLQEVKNIVQLKCIGDELSDDILETVYNSCNLNDYSDDWLRDNASKWIRVRNIEYVIRKATAYMKTANLNTDNAEEVVENIKSMITTETAVNFDTSIGVDFFDADSHATSELVKHSTGYPYIDACLKGGYYMGGLFVFLAGPKCGKSFWLCNLAAQSVKMGNNTLYITLELAEGMVNKRISSNLMDMTMDEYSKKCKDKDFMRTKLNELKTSSLVPMGAMRVKQFPTSTLSPQTLCSFVKKLEEQLGYKFKNIFIDYINIMQNAKNPNSENTYLKIKTIAEDLRAVSIANDWTIISVTQTTRDGWDTTDLTTKDISESGGLLHTVDGLFGIITNPEMKANGEYYVKALAMRDGENENTKKHYFINWAKGRITEDTASKIEDCSMANMLNAHNNNGRGKRNNNNMTQQAQAQAQLSQAQQAMPNSAPQMVYKNNTHFKKGAKVGHIFKCELSVIESSLGDMSQGEKLFMTNSSDSKKIMVVRYTGDALDNRPMFEILKFVNKSEGGEEISCLSDIFHEDKSILSKIVDGSTLMYAVCEHPFDIREDMMVENEPMSTNAFTNNKQLINNTSMGIDLDNLNGGGLFDIQQVHL